MCNFKSSCNSAVQESWTIPLKVIIKLSFSKQKTV